MKQLTAKVAGGTTAPRMSPSPYSSIASTAASSISASLLSSSLALSMRYISHSSWTLEKTTTMPAGERRGGGEGLRGGSDDDEANFGVFQHMHVNDFPVRAAIDIGTGGVVSLCIGRVDANRQAVQRVLYQTQLPLYIEAASPSITSQNIFSSSFSSSSSSSSSTGTHVPHFVLSEATVTDVHNKMRVLHGAMRRDAYEGLSERAAVITWPLCEAQNAEQLARDLTREFKVDVRVLGKSFSVGADWVPAIQSLTTLCSEANSSSTASSSAGAAVSIKSEDSSRAAINASGRVNPADSLKMLLARAKKRRSAKGEAAGNRKGKSASHQQQQQREEDEASEEGEGGAHGKASEEEAPAQAQVEQLSFLAHSALAQCVAPQRLLVIAEDPQKGIRIVGANTTLMQDAHDLLGIELASAAASSGKEGSIRQDEEGVVEEQLKILHRAGATKMDVAAWRSTATPHTTTPASDLTEDRISSSLADRSCSAGVVPLDFSLRQKQQQELLLVEHRIPVDVSDALRTCVVNIQRRSADSFHLHTSSPNPLQRAEFTSLVSTLTDVIRPTLPQWVLRKSRLGGVICGTGFNGSMLNIAARVAQKTSISLDHLETHAEHHFCGLTDILLADNFPNPLLVLPSAALACALCRALETPRIAYLPEVTTAAALLVHPELWVHGGGKKAREKRRTLQARLGAEKFFQSAQNRTYTRPHLKHHPTAAPGATWQTEGQWNDLSYGKSMRGT